ncbi:MAG: hypothetical protein ACMUJM_23160 [bacterium]
MEILSIFPEIIISDMISSELNLYNIGLYNISNIKLENVRNYLIKELTIPFKIHEPDKSILILAKKYEGSLILSDDLELRRAAQFLNIEAMGTVGILVKAFKKGILSHQALFDNIDILFENSSLFTSKVFKDYVKNMIKKLV